FGNVYTCKYKYVYVLICNCDLLGFSEYSIGPFDPFFIPDIFQKRTFSFANYKLILMNVTEAGWTESRVTKVRSDFPRHQIHITQFFPDKRLDGWYEIEGTFFGQKVHNRGSWNLSLFDYVQTLTITRKPVKGYGGDHDEENPPLSVKCNIQTCQKLELHIDHLAGGRTIVENMLDWIINNAWQPGFVILRPLINDLVGTAFTDIFNDYFRFFPFDTVFTKR
ncbi:hypothetical protein NQ318_018312, partial [Aromia moschata]